MLRHDIAYDEMTNSVSPLCEKEILQMLSKPWLSIGINYIANVLCRYIVK